MRERGKGVVQAVEKALEGIENVIGGVVGKKLSLISTDQAATSGPLRIFDVGGNVMGTVSVTAKVETEAPIAIDGIAVSAPSTLIPVEETIVVSAEPPPPADGALPETGAPAMPEPTADLPDKQLPSGSDVETSMITVTVQPVESNPETEIELTECRVETPFSSPEVPAARE